MAQSIGEQVLNRAAVREGADSALWKLRLSFGGVILFGALIGLFALSWDIQWHSAVGRDRTLTAPHLFILGSVAIMGIAALAAVCLETVWARRSASIARGGTSFAGFFSSSLGAYLAGYGALDAAIGFPIDQYWHTLYGVDVAIWAPFHIMLLTGFCVCSLGAAYMLAEGTHLAARTGARDAARAGYVGAIVAFATLMGMLSILLPESLSMGYLSLGNVTFTVYPLMLGAFGAFVFLASMRALPGRATATGVAIVYALFGLISYLIIPPLMSWLLGVEQQTLLPRAPRISVLATGWQYPLLIAAVLLDITAWLARRSGWSRRKTTWLTFAAAAIGLSLAALFAPFIFRSQFLLSAQRHVLSSIKGPGVLDTAVGVQTASPGLNGPVVMVVLISLLIGLLGIYIGTQFGTTIGEAIGEKEQ